MIDMNELRSRFALVPQPPSAADIAMATGCPIEEVTAPERTVYLHDKELGQCTDDVRLLFKQYDGGHPDIFRVLESELPGAGP